MIIEDIRKDIDSMLDNIDVDELKAIHTILVAMQPTPVAELDKYGADEVVGYDVGTDRPITKQEMITSLDKAVGEIDNGETISLAEMKKSTAEWLESME